MSYPPPTPDPFQQYPQPGYQNAPPGAGMAIASMVCGILSIVCCLAWYLSGPLGIVGLCLGLSAKGRIRRGVASGDSMATAGIICGTIGMVLTAIAIGLVIFAVANGGARGSRFHFGQF